MDAKRMTIWESDGQESKMRANEQRNLFRELVKWKHMSYDMIGMYRREGNEMNPRDNWFNKTQNITTK